MSIEILVLDTSYYPEHLPDIVMSSPTAAHNDMGSPGHTADHTDGTKGDRPSNYLRERCPACFGGENWSKPDEM